MITLLEDIFEVLVVTQKRNIEFREKKIWGRIFQGRSGLRDSFPGGRACAESGSRPGSTLFVRSIADELISQKARELSRINVYTFEA